MNQKGRGAAERSVAPTDRASDKGSVSADTSAVSADPAATDIRDVSISPGGSADRDRAVLDIYRRAAYQQWAIPNGMEQCVRDLEAAGKLQFVMYTAEDLQGRHARQEIWFREPHIFAGVSERITLPLDPGRIGDNPWDTPVIIRQGRGDALSIEEGNHRTHKVIMNNPENHPLFAVWVDSHDTLWKLEAAQVEAVRRRNQRSGPE